jgi:hypothetical protein
VSKKSTTESPELERPSSMKRYATVASLAIALVAIVSSQAYSAPSKKMIITWGGNAPGWNEKLHVNAIRIGCSSAPAGCAQAAQKIAREQHVKRVFLAILLTPSSVSYAQQYSALSEVYPVLFSVGFDDFIRQVDKLHRPPAEAASLLGQFIDGLKSRNSGLHFGVTVYENELTSPELSSPAMANVRNRVDFVHLFVHYRQNGPDFGMYVQHAKQLFPSAQIIAGSYPVDRIDYLPCSPNEGACTSAQEISLFDKTFDVQLQLLQSGEIAGIEFYPGDFGDIGKAPLWKAPRSCHPDRLSQCIANSEQMERHVANALSKANL